MSQELDSSNVDWRRRLVTASVAIPALIAAIRCPEPVFSVIIVLAVCVGYKEISNLLKYCLHINFLLIILLYLFEIHALVVFTATVINLLVPMWSQGPLEGMKLGLVNVLYIQMFAVPMLFASRLRNIPLHGPTLTLIWILVSFASDAGALAIGSKYGKHKCCPLISPNKSWEGLLGAVLGGVTVSVTLFTTRIDDTGDISLKDFLAFGMMGSVLGMMGDLVESGLKRYVSTKDASDLLPGHGGLLDRLDSLAASAPFMYYYCEYRDW